MNGLSSSIFVFLIICTLTGIISFRAGMQFFQYVEFADGHLPTENAIRGASPDKEFDSQSERSQKESEQVDNSAMAVDGPIFLNNTQLLFRNVRDKFYHKQQMGGGFFYTPPHDGTLLLRDNETAAKAPSVMTRLVKVLNNHMVTTSLLHSFSPDVERRVKTIFPDPLNENVFYANSPALFWDRDYNDGVGRLIVTMRIWLERERYEQKKNWPQNHFLDNYFYTRTYNNKFEPLDPGHIMGIPTNGGSGFGDGPIEPRLFPAFNRSSLFVSFNTGMTGLRNKHKDYTLIWDFRNNEMAYPIINGFSPMLQNSGNSFPRDKHWSAFNLPPKTAGSHTDVIHLVHNLEPLRILECDVHFECGIIYAAGTRAENVFDSYKHHLRGGTPFVHYESSYYVSFGHVTLFKKRTQGTRRYYTANLVLLRADPEASPPYRIVFVSDPLKIAKKLMYSVPIVRYMYIEDPFIFPVGLLLENRDTAVLGVHLNDHTAMLLRIRGIEALIREAIAADLLPPNTWDPKMSTQQKHRFLRPDELVRPNRFTRLLAEEESDTEFY